MRRQTRVLSSRFTTSQLLLDVPVQDLETSGAPGVDGVCGKDRVEVAVAVHEIPEVA